MKDFSFLYCVASLIVIANCDTGDRHKTTSKKNQFFSMDGYRPYITRPRYGFGKRSEENEKLYHDLKAHANKDKVDEIMLLENLSSKDNQINSEANKDQIPVIVVQSRRLLRQFGRDQTSLFERNVTPGRWERFGGKRGTEADVTPGRWGRFGRERNMESDVTPGRWGRFGRESSIESDITPGRWGRFGRESSMESDVTPGRWGRFGGKRNIEFDSTPGRWERFGGKRSFESDVIPGRWGRFGRRRNIEKSITPDESLDLEEESSAYSKSAHLGRLSDDIESLIVQQHPEEEEEEKDSPLWGRFGGKREVKVLLIDSKRDDENE